MNNIWDDAIKEYATMMPKLCSLMGCNDEYYHAKWRRDGYIDFIHILRGIRLRFWDNMEYRYRDVSAEDLDILAWAFEQQAEQLKEDMRAADHNLSIFKEITNK